MRVENDLKPHNIETVKRILEFFENGNKCCAIQATGTGKTFLILRLLEVFNDEDKKAIILAPNNEIIRQTKKRMKKFGLNNAMFYTYQKLARMTEDEIKEIETDLIVCDELHRTGATLWGSKFEILVATHTDAKIFGATATALRCTDGRDMAEEYFDNNRACDISLAEALVRKIIPVMPLYVSALYTFEEEYQKLHDKIENGNNTKEEKEELQKELSVAKKQLEKANGVPEIIKKYITNYNGKYIVFCKDKTHLYEMKDTVVNWFREAGCNGKIYEYPYYSENYKVKQNLNDFEQNNKEGLKLLFVIDKLNEGLHLDEIHGCILLRTTTSNIVYYQQIGRAIDAGSNERRVILDLVSNFNNLSSCSLKKDIQEKIQERKDGKFSDSTIDFEVDEFNVFDMIQPCVEIFNEIDRKILNCEHWSDIDIETMKTNYTTMGLKIGSLLTKKHSDGAIYNKAYELGLISDIYWKEEEDAILYKYYISEGTAVCEQKLQNRNKRQIENRAHKLGLYKNNRWTQEEIKILKDYYEKVNRDEIQQLLPNKSLKSIQSKASYMKLTRKNVKHYYYNKEKNKYGVTISSTFFGYYETEEQAASVAMKKAKELGIA